MSDYIKAQEKYHALAKAAANGDKQAHADKAKAMNEIRAIEREAARSGTILKAVRRGDKFVVQQEQTDSKRSLQEEYIRKFDNEVTAMLPDLDVKDVDPKKRPLKEQTLREFNRKRLLGK
jgi:homoserine trans-succinylase